MLLRRVVLLALAFVLSACAPAADPDPKPAELIIGRWQKEETFTIKGNREGEKEETFTRKVSIEFGKDGSVTITNGEIPELKTRLPSVAKGSKITVKYAFVKDAEIEVTIEQGGMKVTNRAKVEVTKDELVVTPIAKGEKPPVEKYTRVKG